MRYYQQIIIVALFMQLLVSCWARARFVPDPWSVSSSYWNEIQELDNNDNNDSELNERILPLFLKTKKSIHHNGGGDNNNNVYEDRRKKYLGEGTNFQGGRSLQGLWAMPGRLRWFHRNFVERLHGPSYPYYHCKFGEIQDQICFYEAEMAYLREKRIDTMIIEILHDRLTHCVFYEGRIDALDKCAKEKDALFELHTNWYQKYGEMGVPHSCVDAYMK